jgi:hypothetical protein
MIERINKTMNDGRELSTNNYRTFFFFDTQLHAEILTNKKAALFGSSKLSGHNAQGTLLALWGRSFAVEDAEADVFILYSAPQDSYVLSLWKKGNSSLANNTKMDKNPSHPTNSVST